MTDKSFTHYVAYIYVFTSGLHRESWVLNPPEVQEANLQFAGWGPRGQQLVRGPCDYAHSTVTRRRKSLRIIVASQTINTALIRVQLLNGFLEKLLFICTPGSHRKTTQF